ncbi:hypothetical protein SAPIO_CDS1517 [Scedosporium apiospermum]|uniref:G domain-containing protein n=1 Tax=Pseudallescheria apiosperma TaxID=563466 RepID=A0A084GEG7_PSEDA|nr:uncharacterized protein SAPIO_CDS1517 [Scedosporium apiospermum]KEZ45729.1 hypothetical protein SAPIO_CDS1517 [Scedosporium apiospermum]
MDGEQSSFGDADEVLVHRCVTIPRNDYLIPTAFPDIEVVSFIHNPQLRAHLIDTPGFDDTERSDVQALLDISHWLSSSFKDFLRYGDTLESARGIVEYILSPEREVTLDIQDEIVNEHCKIGDTSAAIEPNAEIIRERASRAETERLQTEYQREMERQRRRNKKKFRQMKKNQDEINRQLEEQANCRRSRHPHTP